MEQAIARIRDARSLRLTSHRTDWPICVPSRASILSGMFAPNHRMTASFEVDEYYNFYRQGLRTTHQVLGSAAWFGPWERDLALAEQVAHGGWGPGGAVTTDPVAASAQGTVGGVTTSRRSAEPRRGDTADDLQAFTGGLFTALGHAGVKCGAFGKWSNVAGIKTTSLLGNPSAIYDHDTNPANAANTYLHVPPGIVRWAVLVGLLESSAPGATDGEEIAGSTGNQWHGIYASYAGDLEENPADGNGVSLAELARFDYDRPYQTLTRPASGDTTLATVGLTAHGMGPGDEFALAGATDPTWNGTTWTVESVPDADHFTYRLNAVPAATSVVGQPVVIYPRRAYAESVWLREFEGFLDQVEDTDPWFAYYAPHNPHKAWGDGASTDPAPEFEVEKRYAGTLDTTGPAHGMPEWHEGPPSSWTDANGVHWTTAHDEADVAAQATADIRAEWQRRQEMMASVDDTIAGMLDACAARGMHNVVIIFTSDNGWPQGEHNDEEGLAGGVDFWTSGKANLWESGVRAPLWIRDPRRPVAATSDVPTSMADLPLTILDLFALDAGILPDLGPLATHHMHAKRDGTSILRLLAEPVDRVTPLFHGQWQTGALGNDNAEGAVDRDNFKLLRARDDEALASVHRLYDVSKDADGVYLDYETTDLAASMPAKLAELNARITPALEQRWDPVANAHSIKGAP